ncbi:hypothetical protein LPJ54_004304, partial [Coemansia sp. RSA 1824]
MTVRLLAIINSPAITGGSPRSTAGYKMPAAIGMHTTLYIDAQIKLSLTRRNTMRDMSKN